MEEEEAAQGNQEASRSAGRESRSPAEPPPPRLQREPGPGARHNAPGPASASGPVGSARQPGGGLASERREEAAGASGRRACGVRGSRWPPPWPSLRSPSPLPAPTAEGTMSAPTAKVSKKELNSNHDGADETAGEDRARRGPGRAAIFRPGPRGYGGPGAGAFFVCGAGRGAGVAASVAGEAGALRPARRAETPPSPRPRSPPPPSLPRSLSLLCSAMMPRSHQPPPPPHGAAGRSPTARPLTPLCFPPGAGSLAGPGARDWGGVEARSRREDAPGCAGCTPHVGQPHSGAPGVRGIWPRGCARQGLSRARRTSSPFREGRF